MIIRLIAAICCSAVTVRAGGPRVLLLGDNGSQDLVAQSLNDAGMQVTVVNNYADWDGVTPSATNFDVLVLLDGENYGSTIQNAAADAIRAYVQGGGGLIMTEWTAYDAYEGTLNPEVANLLPVVSPSGGYSYDGDWVVIETNHPVVAYLSPSWSDPAGFSLVQPKTGTDVIATESYYGVPMIAVSTNAGGPVVYLNHDMTYTDPVLSLYIQQLLKNAVAFCTGTTSSPPSGDVLLLGDDTLSFGELTGSSQTVLAGLRAAGLSVYSGVAYSEWDGMFPNPDQFKAIVFLDGYDYGEGLEPGVSEILTNYVGKGGGLVTTEWTADDVRSGVLDSTFASLMPVVLPASSYSYGATWTVTQPDNPVVATLPAEWSDPTYYSLVEAVPGATVLVSGPTNVPLVTLRSFGSGKVVHINHTLTYDDENISGEALGLIANAAAYVGGLPSPGATNADVLVLGDGGSDLDMIDTLRNAGLTVSFGGRYDAWDGLFPAPTNHAAVLFLDGYDFGFGLQTTAEDALTNYVASGGGLVATEWTAWDAYYNSLDAAFASLLPVYLPTNSYGAGTTWTVNDPNHPILAGLPSEWPDPAEYSLVNAKPGATVLAQDTNGVPMVTFWDPAGGRVVHLNNALTSDGVTPSPEIHQLIVNAVKFAGKLSSASPTIRLSITMPATAGSPTRLQFTPLSGYDCTVQFRDTLDSTDQWQDLPGGPHNSGSVDDSDQRPERFYRVEAQKVSP